MTGMKFSDIKQDTPRLVVRFQRRGKEQLFEWGVVGAVPLLTLIGAVGRVQGELAFKAGEECPDSALCVAFFEGGSAWFVHQDIPTDALLGMLEVIKATLVATQAAQNAGAKLVPILGPDGQPIRRGR